MDRTVEPSDGRRPSVADALVVRARDVLDANWLGHATSPSARLYPHQWSWDSAFIAIGCVRYDEGRAQAELESLFAGQWANGLLPHIVFVDDARPYFPGPEVWLTQLSPHAPNHPRTSGIVQPPVHATAVWHVYRHSTDKEKAAEFLARMLPRLTAWHDYLFRERTRDGGALVEIWHPWESGMDNSPLWDDILARIPPDPRLSYQRTDLLVAEPAERPTDAEYDRYVHLVTLFRDCRYDSNQIRKRTPFAVRDVLFNALLVQADRDLASIAREIGAPERHFVERADATAQAIEAELWHGTGYLDFDITAGEPINTPVWSRFSPLFAGIPQPERAAAMVERLRTTMVTVDGVGAVVPSLPRDDPHFDPTLYWRGPVWINANWLIYHGLRRYGHDREAASLRKAVIELARRGGFSEHYHPITGHGHGGAEFAWSAALVLDLLHED